MKKQNENSNENEQLSQTPVSVSVLIQLEIEQLQNRKCEVLKQAEVEEDESILNMLSAQNMEISMNIKFLDKTLDLLKSIPEGVEVETLKYDNLEDIPHSMKESALRDFGIKTAKFALLYFKMFGLKTHIEQMIIDDNTKEGYIFSFRKHSN